MGRLRELSGRGTETRVDSGGKNIELSSRSLFPGYLLCDVESLLGPTRSPEEYLLLYPKMYEHETPEPAAGQSGHEKVSDMLRPFLPCTALSQARPNICHALRVVTRPLAPCCAVDRGSIPSLRGQSSGYHSDLAVLMIVVSDNRH